MGESSAVQSYSMGVASLADAPTVDTEVLLATLLARDTVQEAIDKGKLPASDLMDVSAADAALAATSGKWLELHELDRWRATVRPETNAWWWFPTSNDGAGSLGMVDQVANVLTAALIGLTASFSLGVIQALSSQGISWEESFSSLVHGTGLVLLGGGAFTQKGRSQIGLVLDRIQVPGRYQAEAMTLAAAVMAVGTWYAHSNLLPEQFQTWGIEHYEAGNLASAESSLLRAHALDPEREDVLIYLGRIYETVDRMPEARTHYEKALLNGNISAFNYLGRVALYDRGSGATASDPLKAEALFRLGLQRVYVAREQANDPTHLPDLEYQLTRNLGWALLHRARATTDETDQQQLTRAARRQLLAAQAMEKRLDVEVFGYGMSHCLLAAIQQGANDKLHLGLEQVALEACRAHAKPETITEYEWLVALSATGVSSCVQTHTIMQLLPADIDDDGTRAFNTLREQTCLPAGASTNGKPLDCLCQPEDTRGARSASAIEENRAALQAAVEPDETDPMDTEPTEGSREE